MQHAEHAVGEVEVHAAGVGAPDQLSGRGDRPDHRRVEPFLDRIGDPGPIGDGLGQVLRFGEMGNLDVGVRT